MIIGYARVSPLEQNLDRQLDALIEYGVDKRNIYTDKITGTKKDRYGLKQMLEELQLKDIIVITDLTRISRSTKDLLSTIDTIRSKGISIKSLKDTWLDTTTDNPYNDFLLTVMSGLSQLENFIEDTGIYVDGLNAAEFLEDEIANYVIDYFENHRDDMAIDDDCHINFVEYRILEEGHEDLMHSYMDVD